ncbi:MAG: outer membrane lipoprotein-sorting protein [Pseudomonadales bacterium]|nr:outer membrane lipoprotein-sorting protein [Pseudomonadales bacterium]
MQVGLKMILVSPKGSRTERSLRIQQLESDTDGDKVLVVFDIPASIRGTALLSHAHLDRDDDQWLYLPALKRTKKIASRNKTGPFVGSEFAFEDLAPQEVEKYDYAYVGEETIGQQPCFVVDRFPKDRYSGYTRQRVWLDQEHLRTLRIDFFDRGENNSKQLLVSDYEVYQGQFWKPAFMQMKNLRTHKSTELYWQDYDFQLGFDEGRDFSVNSLRRAR